MYKLIFVIAATCVIAAFSQTALSTGSGLFVCGKEGKLLPGEELQKRLAACNNPDLYKEKDLRCIAVCTTEAVGGLKDGIPDKDAFINIIKTEFPEAEQADALERAEKCFEGRTFDKDDKTCATVAEFSACGTKLVVETKC